MECSKHDKIVATPSSGDEARRQALQELVKKGCLTSLYNHAQTSSRIDWIRNYCLLALTKFASINTTITDVAITLQDDEIPLDSSLNTLKLKKKAAKLLFLFSATPKKPRKFKKIAIMGLIQGKNSEYFEELLRDDNVEDWIKTTIISAMKMRK